MHSVAVRVSACRIAKELDLRDTPAMTLKRMDNVLIVVENMETVKAFFAEIGMAVEGEMTVEGPWVDSVIGLTDARSDICVMRTPDGHGKVELSRFQRPAVAKTRSQNEPANTLGISRIMFAVEGIDDVVARLQKKHGAELIGGKITQYENAYRLCYMRGPEGILIALAEEMK